MILTIEDENYLFQERAPFEFYEFKGRYEIHSTAESEDEQALQLTELYRWLRLMVHNGKFKHQCAASAVPTTVYIFKQPLRVTLEQHTTVLDEGRKPKFPLRG